MKIRKYEPRKRKPIREVETKKDYSGEASPYWDFLADHSDTTNKEIKVHEDPLANPDVYSEEKSMYNRGLSVEGELRLQAIHETLEELSDQQRNVLHLCGDLGLTMGAAAIKMGIKLATVQTLLNRARAKIKRRYDKLMTLEE